MDALKAAHAGKGFNGAVTFSLRKLCYWCGLRISEALLQWGRNFFVTEIAQTIGHLLHKRSLQWGRNFFVTEIRKKDRRRKLFESASMGP